MGGDYLLFLLLVVAAFVFGGIGAAAVGRFVYGTRFVAALQFSLAAFGLTMLLFGYLYFSGRGWSGLHFLVVAFLMQACAMFFATSPRPATFGRIAKAALLALVPTAIVGAVTFLY